jgi:hypothetical protein
MNIHIKTRGQRGQALFYTVSFAPIEKRGQGQQGQIPMGAGNPAPLPPSQKTIGGRTKLL